MFNYFKVLTSKDLGIEGYTDSEIAAMMKPIDNVDASGLCEFAHTVNSLLEDEPASLVNCVCERDAEPV